MSVNYKIVNTDQFWKRLCDFRSVRIDEHNVAIGNTMYVTKTSPEEIPGFIEAKLKNVANALNLKKL